MKGQRTKPKLSASSFTSLFFTMGPFVNVCRLIGFMKPLEVSLETDGSASSCPSSLYCALKMNGLSFTGAIRVESALRDETAASPLWDTACLLSWITVSPHPPCPQLCSFYPPQHKATSTADTRFDFLPLSCVGLLHDFPFRVGRASSSAESLIEGWSDILWLRSDNHHSPFLCKRCSTLVTFKW